MMNYHTTFSFNGHGQIVWQNGFVCVYVCWAIWFHIVSKRGE